MSESELQHFKQKFAITPKTAKLLLGAGYQDYRDLQHVSPNHVVAQFATQAGVDAKLAKGYQRALRRIVWLGTQKDPERQAKICKDWTNKALMARGVWVEGFDDLTGKQMNELFKKARKENIEKK